MFKILKISIFELVSDFDIRISDLVTVLAVLILFLFCSKPVNATNTGRFTISVWVNPTTSIVSKAIIAKAEELRLVTDASGNPLCQIKATSWQEAATSSVALPLNTWSHVLCTYDLTNIKIYINGVLKSTTALTAVPDDTSAVFYAGRDASAGTTYGFFTGLIDEYKFYYYALTEDEINIDYNSGSARVMGSLSSDTGNTAPSTAASQEYCIPGDTATCSPPVARWDFNEGIGSSAYDTSGNGNNGGLGAGTAAPSWTTGKVGKGLRFDGSNDYVNVGNPSSLQIATNGQITMSTWIKVSSFPTSGNFVYFIGKGYDGTEAYFLRVKNNSGTLRVDAGSYDGTDHMASWNISSWNTNEWHHLTGVYNGTKWIVYFDGIQKASTTTDGPENNNMNVSIGAFYNSGSFQRFFSGIIDQVHIYNYARTPAQIAWDYNKGKPVAYYDFNECQGTTIHDAGGVDDAKSARNDGTVAIGPLGSQSLAGTCAMGLGSTAAWGVGSTGKYGASLSFDGTDDYAVTSNVALAAGVGGTYSNVSFGSWVYPTTSAAGKTIVHKNNEFKLTTDADSKANCAIYSGGSWQTAAISSSALSLSTWSHVLCTYDGTNIKVYINGVNKGNQAETDQIISLSSTALSIARDSAGSGYFQGQLDDIKVWNYGLTSTQVKLEYNQGSAVRFSE